MFKRKQFTIKQERDKSPGSALKPRRRWPWSKKDEANSDNSNLCALMHENLHVSKENSCLASGSGVGKVDRSIRKHLDLREVGANQPRSQHLEDRKLAKQPPMEGKFRPTAAAAATTARTLSTTQGHHWELEQIIPVTVGHSNYKSGQQPGTSSQTTQTMVVRVGEDDLAAAAPSPRKRGRPTLSESLTISCQVHNSQLPTTHSNRWSQNNGDCIMEEAVSSCPNDAKPSLASTSSTTTAAAPVLASSFSQWLHSLPQMGPDGDIYAQAHFHYLLQSEANTCVANNYLTRHHLPGELRSTLNNWLIKVQIYLDHSAEALHLAVAFCDYYLTHNHVDESRYQLLVITAFFISVKLVERFPPRVAKLCYLTDNFYDEKQLLAFETVLLHGVQFHCFMVTPIHLLEHMLRACVDLAEHQVSKLIRLCHYLFDLLLLDATCGNVPPSKRTAAAILFGRRVLFDGMVDAWTLQLHTLTGYDSLQLQECVQKYFAVLLNARKVPHNAAHEKHSGDKYGGIALCAEIKKLQMK